MTKQEKEKILKRLNEETEWTVKNCTKYLATGESGLFLREVGGLIEIVCFFETIDEVESFPRLKEYYMLMEIQRQMLFGVDEDEED